jgi:lipopolysaccharide transport system permease protein
MPKKKTSFLSLSRFHFQLDMYELRHAWELLIAMTEREIKVRYKHALLGFLWIILNPLLQMVVIGSVFSFVFKVPIADYFLFLFTGLLIWNYFSLTITKVTPSIVFELNLIEKAKFPREIIVLSIILSNLFHTLIALLLFVFLLLALGKIDLPRLLLLPVPFIWITILNIGLGFFTSALNTQYRDINFFVQALIPLWFYATPIAFNLSLVPDQLHFFLFLNPLVGCVELAHWVLNNGQFPSAILLLSNIFLTFILLLLGLYVFRKKAPFFDDWT